MATLTKFGWFDTQDDNHVFRTITDDIGQFLQGSIDHCIIGVKILAELVSLINQVIHNLFAPYIPFLHITSSSVPAHYCKSFNWSPGGGLFNFDIFG